MNGDVFINGNNWTSQYSQELGECWASIKDDGPPNTVK